MINVGVSGDAEVVVKLQGATGNPITFDADDFNDAVVDETGYNLNYVVFDYTSGRGGYLYFDYGGGSEDEKPGPPGACVFYGNFLGYGCSLPDDGTCARIHDDEESGTRNRSHL